MIKINLLPPEDRKKTRRIKLPTLSGGGPTVNLIDAGFENGSDGVLLASPPWTLSGTPQRREYDALRAKVGAKSGWIQGPTTAAYAGVGETASAGMTANTAEQRFWIYLDTANQYRVFEDFASATVETAQSTGRPRASASDVMLAIVSFRTFFPSVPSMSSPWPPTGEAAPMFGPRERGGGRTPRGWGVSITHLSPDGVVHGAGGSPPTSYQAFSG